MLPTVKNFLARSSHALVACGLGLFLFIAFALKPSPKSGGAAERVYLRGTASASLDVELNAAYVATNPRRVGCSREVAWGVRMPNHRIDSLDITWAGDNWSTSVQVNRYRPGWCGWRFQRVYADVSKGALISIPNSVLSNPKDGTRAWKGALVHDDDAPVVWECRFSRLADLTPGVASFACGELQRGKSTHLLDAEVDTYIIHFVDLES